MWTIVSWQYCYLLLGHKKNGGKRQKDGNAETINWTHHGQGKVFSSFVKSQVVCPGTEVHGGMSGFCSYVTHAVPQQEPLV